MSFGRSLYKAGFGFCSVLDFLGLDSRVSSYYPRWYGRFKRDGVWPGARSFGVMGLTWADRQR